MKPIVFLLMVGLALISGNLAGKPTDLSNMLESIEKMTTQTTDYTGVAQIDPKVIEVLSYVDRATFVPDSQQPYAYLNQPLPIGHQQTISQPYIVALMTHVLDVQSGDKVLEIGTGSGYQAAILAELCESLYSIEIVPELAQQALQLLDSLGFENVNVKAGDGWHGWPSAAPFDKIIVTAVAPQVPPSLLSQLKDGGLMVLPIERDGGYQELVLIQKVSDQDFESKSLLPVRFVPMTGEAEKN